MFTVLYLLVLFLLVLNFLLAIIVEAYMQLRAAISAKETEQSFFTDLLQSVQSLILGKIRGWPSPRWLRSWPSGAGTTSAPFGSPATLVRSACHVAACCLLLPAACCLLPAACCLLSAACCLLACCLDSRLRLCKH